MNTAVLSLAALAAAIALSARKGFHAGVVALALAALVARSSRGAGLEGLAELFPAGLFLTLVGVTLLFGMARANGALERLTAAALRASRCRASLLPPAFFALALAVSALGAGNIAAVALLAPVALPAGAHAGVGPGLTAMMLISGANAGAFSPLAFTGVVAAGLSARAGLELSPWRDIFLPSLAAQCLAGAAAYAWSWRSLRGAAAAEPPPARGAASRAQRLTLAAVAGLAAAVLLLKTDVGTAAFALSVVLALAGAADHEEGLARVPWAAVLMVCGVSTLVGLASEGGGLSLVAGWLSAAGRPPEVTGAAALAAAFTSVYSSSSGVVMPAFLSMVPELASRSGAEPRALVAAINVGSHLVDISPLSTLGALCVAAAPAADRERLFGRLLAGGLAMTLAAGLLGWLVFGRGLA